jgi:hypothetical protein
MGSKIFFFWCSPFGYLYFLSFLIMNEPGIDPGMALTPLPSSIGRGSIPRPSNREPSTLPPDHSFHYYFVLFYGTKNPNIEGPQKMGSTVLVQQK